MVAVSEKPRVQGAPLNEYSKPRHWGCVFSARRFPEFRFFHMSSILTGAEVNAGALAHRLGSTIRSVQLPASGKNIGTSWASNGGGQPSGTQQLLESAHALGT